MSLATLATLFAGGFGTVAFVVGSVIALRPDWGKRLFDHWSTATLNAARVAVSTSILASAWAIDSPLVLGAGCVFAVATLLLGVFSIWRGGHAFVQAHLVESERGLRAWAAFVMVPMGALLLAGALPV